MSDERSPTHPPENAASLTDGLRDSLFRSFVETVGDYAIFVLDPRGVSSRGTAGASASRAIRRRDRRFAPLAVLPARIQGHAQEMLDMAAATGAAQEEGWRIRKDGSRFWASVVITALRDAEGRLLGYSKIVRDLTERRAEEERARHAEERFRLLIEGVTEYAIFL
jgi:PAS domain-containing protein